MSKPTVTIGTATKKINYDTLVKYVSQGDVIDGSAGDTTLTTADFGRTVIINSSSNRTVYLPSVDADHVGGWFQIIKLGTGNVTIDAADSDTIQGGAAGGTLVHDRADEGIVAVVIQLVSSTGWAIRAGTGAWKTSAALFSAGFMNAPLLKQISTPATPAAGYNRLYPKSDKHFYALDEDGVETLVPTAPEVLPIMISRRWFAGRASGSAWLNALLDSTYGGTGSVTYPAADPHYARITSGATLGNAYYWTSQNNSVRLIQSTSDFDVTFRVYFETLANIRAWIGLANTVPTDNLDDPDSAYLAIFRFSTAVGANIYAVTKDGTTINAVSTGVAAAASWFTLRIVGSASNVKFYVNGVLTNTLTANLPGSTGLLALALAQTLTGSAAYLRLGSISGLFNG